ncbi:helix-turn-helix domain-containing protein [Candidatus Berkiella cookevillensis]|uniref:Helix-turn-helix domain protein n=1 Tax=Candidatus Berkiella cookevillensis TaxID=437022 RepID=A0A0Q9YKT5_9GAMM|nr:helix-turn-helix domain-containing protein [Candidatus Berkiella cookevillensis]MCS5707356.1 helix-turn-helix domain-containing protein [Candidatus Berkiella cookevillensis]
MPIRSHETPPPFGEIETAKELGNLIRKYRKSQGLTLEKVSALTNVGTRFLSELERGKETAELGKTLLILNKLGITVNLQPRGQTKSLLPL